MLGILRQIQGWAKIKGGTDGEFIGNKKDRLKVDANFGDQNRSIDLANRVRVGSEEQLFSVLFNYNKSPFVFSEDVTSGATIESTSDDETNPAYVKFNLPTTSGAKAVFGSKRYLRYQPNRTHTNTWSMITGDGDANQESRYGIFDDHDGLYWAKLNNVWNIGYRNSTFQTAGTTIETNVAQPDWDDPLDGTGESGLDFFSNGDNTGVDGSLDNANTFLISWLWHGASEVKWLLNYNGNRILVHRLNPSAENAKPFTRISLLPFRFEIENTGTTSSALTEYLGPVSFDVSGGSLREQGYRFAYHMGNKVDAKEVKETYVNLLALRVKANFENQTSRGLILPEGFTIYTDGDIQYELIIDSTVSGGTWTDVASDSIAEVNQGAFTYTGGRVIDTDVLSQEKKEAAFSRSAPIDQFVANDTVTGDQLSLVLRARRYSSNGECVAGFGWREVY